MLKRFNVIFTKQNAILLLLINQYIHINYSLNMHYFFCIFKIVFKKDVFKFPKVIGKTIKTCHRKLYFK